MSSHETEIGRLREQIAQLTKERDGFLKANERNCRELKEQIAQLTEERDRLKDAAYQYIETLSECVSDQIDPSVNVGWMRMSPKLPEYVQAVEKERDELAAKCAEMRDQLTQCKTAFNRHGWDTCQLDSVLNSDQCGVGWLSPKQQDEEIGRWQEAIYDLCCKFCPDTNIDGAGCDSGDPLDFTLSEIGQALAHLQNKIDERLSPDKKKVLVEALEKIRFYPGHSMPGDRVYIMQEIAAKALEACKEEAR